MGLAAIPPKPGNAVSIASFGVAPSDTTDSTGRIQAALDALQPGQWLVFPAGTYRHSKSLRVRVPGVVLWSEGARLVATNPDDAAIMMQADGSSLYGFLLHAITNMRGSKLQQARIAIAPAGTERVRNVTVRRNVIENAGAPGTPLANGSSASGIIVYHADGFLVAENTVKRTLADAIHVTAGSINGRVIKNTVRDSGDDMIGVVSYMASADATVDSVVSTLPSLRAERLNRNLLLARNDLAGQYWGRGIAVVGGEDVTIRDNVIANATYSAGILLARETAYRTFGVHNVLLRNNTVQHVQTTAPTYSLGTLGTVPRTGNAAIEIQSQLSADEAGHPKLRAALAVDRIGVSESTIDDTLRDAIRIGAGAGPTGLVSLTDNRLSNIGRLAIDVQTPFTPQYNLYCARNTLDGSATSSPSCTGPEPQVSGAILTCSE